MLKVFTPLKSFLYKPGEIYFLKQSLCSTGCLLNLIIIPIHLDIFSKFKCIPQFNKHSFYILQTYFIRVVLYRFYDAINKNKIIMYVVTIIILSPLQLYSFY